MAIVSWASKRLPGYHGATAFASGRYLSIHGSGTVTPEENKQNTYYQNDVMFLNTGGQREARGLPCYEPL